MRSFNSNKPNVVYRECLKNHAAAIGRAAYDGCQEFLAVGREGTPEAFNKEQKQKMLDLAEKLGWRVLKEKKELIHHYCEEIGVKTSSFRDWVYNNKP
ncbi:zinc-finger homeodomain protein 5-like [Diospyros lotus]|uniref:zinc-finger homeodomain protein 5-like n=1 Tax=Diospyros lotus TaxID=55363 RepID=UPI0022594015|nr:zinc-finger homeodomain protein 5-like [Diospyros lotus]